MRSPISPQKIRQSHKSDELVFMIASIMVNTIWSHRDNLTEIELPKNHLQRTKQDRSRIISHIKEMPKYYLITME